MRNRLSNLVLLPLIFLAVSCVPEKKLARDFIAFPEKVNLQVFSPEGILKYNHKGERIEGFQKMKEKQQDSALFYSSDYLQYVDDSIYLTRYMNMFLDELKRLGFNVFVDNSVDTFLQNSQQSYVLNMAQLQLDEYFLPYDDQQTIGDTTYKKHFNLNAVDASTWFELSKLNASEPKKTVLFSSLTASDAFEGDFYVEPFSMSVHYQYSLDSLRLRDIYDLATFTGRQHADYLFDYFMNNYVAVHLQGNKPQGYLHYDRRDHTLYFTEDEKFEVLK